jgi:hypothetical protein
MMPWISPFSLPGRWFKGNLHTHTTQSDGLLTPDQAIAWYRERGYNFLAVTDHWVLSRRRTFAPNDGFITISGAELHGDSYHMLALGISALPDQGLADTPQVMADAVLSQGGLPFIAHPYWTGQTSAEVAPIKGILGIEVFNSVCEKMDGRGYASVYWDDLLARGLRLTGLAVDDVHWKHGEEGQGFVMVRAEKLDEPSILEALRRGYSYASSGPKISDLYVTRQEDGRLALRVCCSPCRSITFYASGPRGHRFEAPAGELLDSATQPIHADQVYLRVECRDAHGGIAWTNPIFVEDVISG